MKSNTAIRASAWVRKRPRSARTSSTRRRRYSGGYGARGGGFFGIADSIPSSQGGVHETGATSPEEAQVLRRIFQMYADGAGLTMIARVLNAERLPSPSGGRRWKAKWRGWSYSTISVIVKN